MIIGFYATIRRSASFDRVKTAWLAGPYLKHEDAQAVASRAHSAACEIDGFAAFDPYGTSSITRENGPLPAGVLNSQLGLTLDDAGFVITITPEITT